MNTTLQIFKRQRELLELGWTQHVAARNAANEPVNSTDPAACKWCWLGAMWRACKDVTGNSKYYYRPETGINIIMDEVLWRLFGRHNWVGFNDVQGTTHSMILAYSDECIKRAEALT